MSNDIVNYLNQMAEDADVDQRDRSRDRTRRRDRDRDRSRRKSRSHRDRSGERSEHGERGSYYDNYDDSPRDRYDRDGGNKEEGYGYNNDQDNGNYDGKDSYNNRDSRRSRRRERDYSGSRGRRDSDGTRSYTNEGSGQSQDGQECSGSTSPDPPRYERVEGIVHEYNHGRSSRETYSAEDRDRELRDMRDSRIDRGGEPWMSDTPTSTIMLRGLVQSLDEKDICADLVHFGDAVKEVRLMRRRDTGASRGFAFVEFQNVVDAQRWMTQNQRRLVLANRYTVNMYYSKPKKDPGRQPDNRAEWICGKCGTNNFKRREFCYKCNFSREGSEGDGFDHVGNNPCNTLIFRGLDALTTEENIVLALGRVSTLPVKNIKVIRDELTGTSRSYGFVEMSALSHATQVVDAITQSSEPFEVDGKAIIVAYAKNTFSTVMATLSQQKQYAQVDYSSYYQQEGAGYYDQNGQYYDYSAYYNYNQTDASQVGVPSTQTDVTNAAAAVAQAAIQQAQAAKQYQHEARPKAVAHIQQQPKGVAAIPEEKPQPVGSQPQGEYQKYPVPDVSTYQYDDSSGYYYDPATGLYYDANSQYYYNSQTGQFLYWDGGKETYLPAPTEQQQMPAPQVHQPQPAETASEKKDDDQKIKKDKEKKEKVKVAKKIAKDMEKWAKTLNARKEAMKDVFKKTITPAPGIPILADKEAAIADVGYAVLEKRAIADLKGPDAKGKDMNLMMPPPTLSLDPKQSEILSSLVASYGGENDSEEEFEEGGVGEEGKLVDLAKMACLLCRRQFPNKEALTRHTQLSDLHKKNLDDYLESRAQSGVPENNIQYRDRAKERRDKYGTPEPPLPKKGSRAVLLADLPIPFEQPTQTGIGGDNIGNKLLQKMGWSEGQGLGKQGQGIVDPVQATRRQAQAGLGARGSRIANTIPPGSTYRETGKKMMFARYHELEDTI